MAASGGQWRPVAASGGQTDMNREDTDAFLRNIDSIIDARNRPSAKPARKEISIAPESSKSALSKLGAAYNLFDGEELLEQSILSLRPIVSYVVVVYQRRSNFGEPCSPRLLPLLRRLKDEMLVDEIVEYENPKSGGFSKEEKISLVSSRATGSDLGGARAVDIADPFFNELKKRELGRNFCMNAGCTHFMSIDTDEFYQRDQLKSTWERMISGDYDVVACRMRFFFKFPRCELIPMDEENYVAAIFRVDPLMPMRLGHPYPVLLDPTRRIFGATRLLTCHREDLEMYHYSFVRLNILSKVLNVTNRGNYEHDLRAFLSSWPSWRPGQPLFHPHPYFSDRFKRTRIVPNWFDICIGQEFSLNLMLPVPDKYRKKAEKSSASASASNYPQHARTNVSKCTEMTPSLARDMKLLKSSASELFASRRYKDASMVYLEIVSALEYLKEKNSSQTLIFNGNSINPIKALKVNAATCNMKAHEWQKAFRLCNEVLVDDETEHDPVTDMPKSTKAKAFYTRALSRWKIEQTNTSKMACLSDLEECIAVQGSSSSQVDKLKWTIEKAAT